MIKAIIFDLDGTLLNTSVEINLLLNRALQKFNIVELSLEKTIEFIGDGAKKLIQRAIPPNFAHLTEEVYDYFSYIYANSENANTFLYEGEAEFLYKLKSKAIKLAIITNKPQAATNAVCKKLLSEFGFEIILGESQKYPKKPNPQSTLYTVNKLGVKNEECLFVGDGETDVQTAINANVKMAAVLWGYRSKAQLKAAGAVNFVNSYAELDRFLQNI